MRDADNQCWGWSSGMMEVENGVSRIRLWSPMKPLNLEYVPLKCKNKISESPSAGHRKKTFWGIQSFHYFESPSSETINDRVGIVSLRRFFNSAALKPNAKEYLLLISGFWTVVLGRIQSRWLPDVYNTTRRFVLDLRSRRDMSSEDLIAKISLRNLGHLLQHRRLKFWVSSHKLGNPIVTNAGFDKSRPMQKNW